MLTGVCAVFAFGVDVRKLCFGLMVATTSKVLMGDIWRGGAVEVVMTAAGAWRGVWTGGGGGGATVGVEAPDLAAVREVLSSFIMSPSLSRLSRRRWLSRLSRSFICCFCNQERLASSSVA